MLHLIYALKFYGFSAEYDANLARIGLEDFMQELPRGEEVYITGIRQMALHLYGAALHGTDKDRFLDKTNRYYYIIPELLRVFPQARFVFLLRNPLAVLNSVLSTWTKDHYDLLYLYRDDLLEAPRRIDEGIRLVGDAAVVVRYENLVTEPEVTVRDICEKLSLPYSSSMLRYGDKPVLRGRLGDQWGLPQHSSPVTTSLNGWKKNLCVPQKAHFMLDYLEHLGSDLVTRMGYSYEELVEEVRPHVRPGHILPWQLAIKPPEHRTLRERTKRKLVYNQRTLRLIASMYALMI